MKKQQTIYIVSGPLGVGKTTLAKILVNKLKNGVLIEGDIFFSVTEKVDKLSWEKRIDLAWTNILDVTRNYVSADLDVVIDFVIEDELNWFIKNIKKLNLQIKYLVLIADKKTLRLRLEKRGEIQYLNRSLRLLEQLTASPSNKEHIIDTTKKEISKIVEEFLTEDKYKV